MTSLNVVDCHHQLSEDLFWDSNASEELFEYSIPLLHKDLHSLCDSVYICYKKTQKVSKWYMSVTFLRWDAILLSSVFKKMVINKEMALTRSNIAWLKMIIWVSGVLIKTVVGEWCFDNLCGSHQFILQSQGIDFSQNPGERLDWSLDREAVGKRMMRLIHSSTCLYFIYHTSWWNVKYFCFVLLTWISGMV